MEPITFQNIQIEGVDFTRILSLEISHRINQHGEAVIKGEIPFEQAAYYLKMKPDDSQYISIKTTAKDQLPILFIGVITDLGVDIGMQYAVLKVKAMTTSILLDRQQVDRSYQNTQYTHEDLMNKAVGNIAYINMEVADRPVGGVVMQTGETNWDFVRRMASRLGACIATTIAKEKTTITIGILPAGKVHNLDEQYTSLSKKEEVTNLIKEGEEQGDVSEAPLEILRKTTEYLFLEDTVFFEGNTQCVSSIYATIESGVLVSTIGIGKATSLVFAQKEIQNTQISGRMLTGQVKEVREDKVKVDFNIDDEYDSSTDVFYPYSTAYSSCNGSGLYCMPAKDDIVRVFFPAADESKAFAASSVSDGPATDKLNKQWRGPGGKQILVTPEGIYITTNADDSQIFINLTDTNGIEITSNKDINICAKNTLTIKANDTISVTAENDIYLATAESYIDMRPDRIELGGDQVVVAH